MRALLKIAGGVFPGIMLACVVLFAVAAFGQSTPTKKPAKAPPPPRLIVSKYMRDMGLLYVEQLETYEKTCDRDTESISDAYDLCERANKDFDGDGTLKALTDRMDMYLNDSNTEADEAYRHLLTRTYYAEHMFIFSKIAWLLREEKVARYTKAEAALPVRNPNDPVTVKAKAEADEAAEEMKDAAKQSIPCMVEAHDDAISGTLDKTAPTYLQCLAEK